MVEETFVSDVSVSVVAPRHDANVNQVFTWRQQYRRGELGGSSGQGIVRHVTIFSLESTHRCVILFYLTYLRPDSSGVN